MLQPITILILFLLSVGCVYVQWISPRTVSVVKRNRIGQYVGAKMEPKTETYTSYRRQLGLSI